MVWRMDDPQGNEAAKIRWELVPYTRGRGLDIGCGGNKAFPHFIGVDNCKDTRLFGTPIMPDIQIDDASDLSMFASGSMDFVFSSHTLEHIQNDRAALSEWWRVIKVGGHLCLYLPHKNFYPNIGKPGANPDHVHDFLPDDITQVMQDLGGVVCVENQERNDGNEYSFFLVFRKVRGTGYRTELSSRPTKSAAIVRYGAYGDLLMASSIFPGLKEQDYHITLYTSVRGEEVIRNDPHIDKIIVQDENQVPNAELGSFWSHIAKKYDRFINLCESIEGTLLTIPGRMVHMWPHEARHALLNRNYLEATHTIADVPPPVSMRFYPTGQEKEWARHERDKYDGRIILWSLAGSSFHKVWPHMDAAIARILLTMPDVSIITVGDELCQLLESPWKDEPRVIRKSGIWSIRQSLAFIDRADLVIGPETGVMNAAGPLPMPKIVTLSHSSAENLTKYWRNVTNLVPNDCPCYPCHRMHYDSQWCDRDTESGAARCQENISPDALFEAVCGYLNASTTVLQRLIRGH